GLVVGSAVMLRLRTPREVPEKQEIAQVQPQAAPVQPGSGTLGKFKAEPAGATRERDALVANAHPQTAKRESRAAQPIPETATRGAANAPSQPVLAEAPAAEAKIGGFGPVKKQAAPDAEKDDLKALAIT